MSIYSIINDEVKSVLRESKEKEVANVLKERDISKSSIGIPELEKIVKAQLPKIIQAAAAMGLANKNKNPISEADDDEEGLESLRLDPEEAEDDLEQRVRAGRQKVTKAAADIAKGLGAPEAVAAMKAKVGPKAGDVAKDVVVGTGGAVGAIIKKFPVVGGYLGLAPLIGAAFSRKSVSQAGWVLSIIALANLFAGVPVDWSLVPKDDLSRLFPDGIPKLTDDVALVMLARAALAGKARKAGNWFKDEKLDRLSQVFNRFVERAHEDPDSSKSGGLSITDKDRGPIPTGGYTDTPVVGRQRVKGPIPTDTSGMFQTTLGKKRKKQQQESTMKKSALMKIIREEVEVVLTNKEASEIFDLDLDRLNEISRPSFREMWNLLSQWIEDQGVHEKSPEYDQMEKEFLAQHGWDQGKFDAAADIAREAGDIAFLEEAWKGDPEVNQTGEYADKTKDELCAMKKGLMDKESRTEPEQKKVRQINFALRSKQKGPKFGKVGC